MAQELCNVEKSLLSLFSMSSQTDLLKQVHAFITIDLIKHPFYFHLGGKESICRTRERESVDASPCHPEARKSSLEPHLKVLSEA